MPAADCETAPVAVPYPPCFATQIENSVFA
jgi:hypothetical protein